MKHEVKWQFLQWDDSKITRFWDFASHSKAISTDYFSYQVGLGIVRFLQYLSPFRGRILDFGCGVGDLSFYLLNHGIACEGVDSSEDSVEHVNQRFKDEKLWGGALLSSGAKLPYADNSIDLILCVETIEHIMPEHIPTLLQELGRILKPASGQLLITTPHAENLELSQVYCPECNSVFHRYQHMSSFTKSGLAALLELNGYKTLICDNTHFGNFQERFIKHPSDWSLRYLPELRKHGLILLMDSLFPNPRPSESRKFQSLIGNGAHLFWLGTKAS